MDEQSHLELRGIVSERRWWASCRAAHRSRFQWRRTSCRCNTTLVNILSATCRYLVFTVHTFPVFQRLPVDRRLDRSPRPPCFRARSLSWWTNPEEATYFVCKIVIHNCSKRKESSRTSALFPSSGFGNFAVGNSGSGSICIKQWIMYVILYMYIYMTNICMWMDMYMYVQKI